MTLDKKKRKKPNKKTIWEREADRLEKQEDLFIVEEILDKKYDEEEGIFTYLVKWEGFPPSENTWEPEHILLEDVPDMVVDYNDRLECMYYQASKHYEKQLGLSR
jgi:3-dehydroquinate dehydratase